MSSFNLGRFVARAGPFGWVAILATLALLIAGGVMLVRGKGRRAFSAYLIASVFPLLCGGAGMVLGNMLVDRAIAEKRGVTEEQVESGRRQAKLPLFMGGIGTLLAAGLGVVGLLQDRSGDRESP